MPSVVRFAAEPKVPLAGTGLLFEPEAFDEQVLGLMTEAVSEAMSLDSTPKALFLSGGLDSSVIACLARSGRPRAFVLYDSADLEDRAMAAKVARELAIELSEVAIDAEQLARDIVHYAWHFEYPIVGGAFDLLGGVAFHAVARRIARDHLVALAGEGGDEIFLGYHRIHMDPQLAASEIRQRATEAGTPAVQDWVQKNLPGDESVDARSLRLLALTAGASEYHMASVYYTGVAFGLECRSPYLSQHLVSLLAQTDENAMIDRKDKWTKVPLRRIARKIMAPYELSRVCERRKLAMPSSVQVVQRELYRRVGGSIGLERVLDRLYRQFHLEDGPDVCPDLNLVDLASRARG